MTEPDGFIRELESELEDKHLHRLCRVKSRGRLDSLALVCSFNDQKFFDESIVFSDGRIIIDGTNHLKNSTAALHIVRMAEVENNRRFGLLRRRRSGMGELPEFRRERSY